MAFHLTYIRKRWENYFCWHCSGPLSPEIFIQRWPKRWTYCGYARALVASGKFTQLRAHLVAKTCTRDILKKSYFKWRGQSQAFPEIERGWWSMVRLIRNRRRPFFCFAINYDTKAVSDDRKAARWADYDDEEEVDRSRQLMLVWSRIFSTLTTGYLDG